MGQTTQILGFFTGLFFVAFVAAGGITFGLRSMVDRVKRKRSLHRQREEFRRRVESTARVARATHSISEWEGWRPLRVVAIVDEAVGIKSFYLSPVDGRALAPFAPGQYLTFRLPQPDGPPIVRCYSLSEYPHEDYYRITVKRIGSPPDKPRLPPGRGSIAIHDDVQIGDVLEARAPAGTFLLDTHSAEPVVLLGAGIGVTPLVSMLGAALHSGRRRTIYALFGFRNGASQPFKEHLESLAREHRNLHLHVSYSAPTERDRLYRDYNHRGRMTLARIREVLPSNNFHFLLCGPGAMMESLVDELLAWGVPANHVHFEAFGPSSVKRLGKPPAVAPCEVRFDRSLQSFTWNGSVDTLLDLGEANGVRMASGCRAGSCGECLTAVRSGKVTPLKSTGFNVPPGHCLTCISMPDGPVVLDA
jgi:ferredoxin-NADP reductase